MGSAFDQPRYVGTTDWTASGKCGAPNDQTSKFAWRQFLSFTMDPRFQDDPSLTKIDASFHASINIENFHKFLDVVSGSPSKHSGAVFVNLGGWELRDWLRLSPFLAFGCLSPRLLYWEILRFEKSNRGSKGPKGLIDSLLWRDFYRFIVFLAAKFVWVAFFGWRWFCRKFRKPVNIWG